MGPSHLRGAPCLGNQSDLEKLPFGVTEMQEDAPKAENVEIERRLDEQLKPLGYIDESVSDSEEVER
jgi:hypothetical protein